LTKERKMVVADGGDGNCGEEEEEEGMMEWREVRGGSCLLLFSFYYEYCC
jgi:hypothetical protein